MTENQQARFKLLLPYIIGVLVGFMLLVGFRYLYVKPHKVHYHSNFALYINGEQDKLDNPGFYEEIQSCWDEHAANPKERVHLHDNNSHVVHVHSDAVTWAHLFSNLGYGLTNTSVQTSKGVFVDGVDGNSLIFILNGKVSRTVANEVIKSEDVLLIDYGKDTAETHTSRFNAIPHDAHEFNLRNDPNTCTGGKSESPLQRLERAIYK